jgi:hypothetical protein
MKMPRTAFPMLVATSLASLAFCSAAPAEELIPPGNSAVNQYTESIPTPGGHRDTEDRPKKESRSPDRALGSRNAQRLEAQGPDGRAAAEAAAATAPSADVEETIGEDTPEEAAVAPTGGGGDRGTGAARKPSASPGTGGGGAAKQPPALKTSVQVDEPEGSSGFGEVLGEATGSSSDGQMGWLLPLIVIGVALWALAYGMRHRRRVS